MAQPVPIVHRQRSAIPATELLGWILIGVGLLLHVYAASRAWLGGDQVHLLRLGAQFAATGDVAPFAKVQALGGGTNPGILLQLLFGVPMMVIEHFRAPMIGIIIMHGVAFILLYAVFRDVFSSRALLPLALVYWLTPWRLYNGSLLWEPVFVFLPAALHLWSCYRLRTKRSFGASAVCIASVIVAMQLHNSFLILAIAMIVLVWRKQIRFHSIGSMVGAVVAGLTLVPSIVAVLSGEIHFAGQAEGFIGKGFLTVAPLLKGVLYWFNLGGVEAVRQLKETHVAQSAPLLIYLLQALCVATVLISVAASWWYFRPLWKRKKVQVSDHQFTEKAQWLRSYAISIFIGLVSCAGLSPITLQGWMVVIALHAASIPGIAWFIHRKSPLRMLVIGVVCYAALEMIVMMTIINGQYIFNRHADYPDMIDPQRDSLLIKYIP